MTADAANLSLNLAGYASAFVFLYLALGLVFAAFFLGGGGLSRLDPVARAGTWGFLLLILPGVVALWPCLLLLARRQAKDEPAGPAEEEA